MLPSLSTGAHFGLTGAFPETLGLIWFLVSLLILDLFDVSLPRGGSIGVGGALCAAALIQFGPWVAIPLCLASLVLALLLRPGARASGWKVGGVATRLVSLLVGTSMMIAFGVGGPDWVVYLVVSAVIAAYLLSELIVAQAGMAFVSRRPLARLIRGNLVAQAPLLVAEWSAAALLLITLTGMGSWSLIPVVALLLLIRQSYSLLLDIRETYRTTVEVLVEAAEGQDPRLAGHAERSAEIARTIAMKVGLTVPQVDLVSFAALLHDVDAIGGDALRTTSGTTGHSSALFEGVDFFADVLPVLRVCDGGSHDGADEIDLLAGLIVALASDADAAEHEHVAAVHGGSAVSRVAPHVSSATKATVVAAALSLGYKIPAVS